MSALPSQALAVAARALVESLPRCEHCSATATVEARVDYEPSVLLCEQHCQSPADDTAPLPYAEALRSVMALLPK